mmetsp:Transcript_46585/g.85358  ORF Transcript_46585/g.85358 Transcript_46585/m.85358 type:complete len:93 (+) Transcript_46585:78-356(+)
MPHFPEDIEYSEKYKDDEYEYRHVTLPSHLVNQLFQLYGSNPRLLHENEWRGLGVEQSLGWVHYMIHRPEPNILLFRRALGTDPQTGQLPQQ